MSELVINVSNIISPLCYTILRLEPYTTCPFKCVYCYSRWYFKNPTDVIAPRKHVVRLFKSIARHAYKKNLKPIPFRLSTLVDPFPPHEELNKISLRILEIAKRFEYPLIINTKSVKLIEIEDVRKVLERLLDNGLAVVQISISTLDDHKARLIEPIAPPPSKRLQVVKELGSRGYPVVIRLSPFIPWFSPTTEEEIGNFMAMLRDFGVKHLIVESLRIEREAVEQFMQRLGVRDAVFEGYSLREVEGMKPVVRLAQRQRVEVYSTLHRYAVRFGIGFATCKEGLFRFHTTDDCCGAYLLKVSYGLRVTLWDFYRAKINLLKHGVEEAELSRVCKQFSRLCMDDLKYYPRIISKPLRYHEKKLLSVLRKPNVLQHIAPDMLQASDTGAQLS